MKKIFLYGSTLLLALLIAGSAMAQELIIYPAQGQSQERLDKDKYECYTWAKGQSGFDPMATPTATSPPPKQETKRGGAVRGAAVGAAAGWAGAKITGNRGSKGAGAGAAAGAVVGGANQRSQNRQNEQAQQQWEKEQAAAYAQSRDGYNRAYSACLEGRGYTVK